MFETTVDFAPLVNVFLQLAVGALVTVGTWALTTVQKRYRVATNLDAGKIFDETAEKAINYARKAIVSSDGKLDFQMQNWIFAQASRYVITAIPDTLKDLGIDQEGVRRRILARLDQISDSGLSTPSPMTNEPNLPFRIPNDGL